MSVKTLLPTEPSITQPEVKEFQAPPPVTFDPSKHLQFSPPSESYSLEDLLLYSEGTTSKVAITKPFLLFTLSGPGTYIIRGTGRNTPFVYDAWHSEAVRKACSEAAGLELEIVFDYEIAHVNVQLDSKSAEVNDIDEFAKVLPNPFPPLAEPVLGQREPADETLKSSDSNGPVWKVGRLPCGKEIAPFSKFVGPGIGYAVMMQGGCINHAALRALGIGERITMVTSFRPRDPLAVDGTTLGKVKTVNNLDQLFLQWTEYRLQILSSRALALREKNVAGDLKAADIEKTMKEWVDEQEKYRNFTLAEIREAEPKNSSY
ncbi:hypothetical protein EJ08DRAFT_724993 [Tothia fuscella]|uniref:Uncharacterized protein n=1 Tax=Tothia fuscella TaxID=1048955 RepID=A0A9P4NJ01_9PEZI|nr:hypothetical protein EJ08DRAFT_724993 [Tothia fuscella]